MIQKIFALEYVRDEPDVKVLRVPGSLSPALHLREGTQVVVRASRGCLLVLPEVDTKGLRARVAELAAELEAVQGRILEIAHTLPDLPGGLLGGEDPLSEELEILGTLECVVGDDIQPAIQKLRLAAVPPGETEAPRP